LAQVVGYVGFHSKSGLSSLNQHQSKQIVHKMFTGTRGPPILRSMKIRRLEVETLVSARHVAALLGCHLETLYTWVKEGRIACVHSGRKVQSPPNRRVFRTAEPGNIGPCLTTAKGWLRPPFSLCAEHDRQPGGANPISVTAVCLT
jgi:excisionase family DNA binding protein